MQDKLPPELERLAALVDQQRPRVREVFHFCLAVALGESSKAELVNTAQVEGPTYPSYRTVADDVFSVVRSGIDAGTERPIRAELVAIFREEGL